MARQRLVELLDRLHRRAVDDAGPRQLLQQRDEHLHLLVLVGDGDHLEREVRPIERGRDDRRLRDAELDEDVVADVRRRGRGRREHRRAAELVDRLAAATRYAGRKSCPHCDTQCASSTTKRDTPTLPDACAQELAELGVGHPLRRGEQELAARRVAELDHRALLLARSASSRCARPRRPSARILSS